jgi:hypothetical protein
MISAPVAKAIMPSFTKALATNKAPVTYSIFPCDAWPDQGTITMRGRVWALIALGAGFNPILTGRETKGWEACSKSNRRLARRAQRRREGASQNIYINGSVLGPSTLDSTLG